MKKLIIILSMAVTIIFSMSFAFIAINWNIDKDYIIKFNCPKGEATMTGLEGKIIFDEKDLAASSINIEVAANTINTGNSMKDSHARGDAWLDVEKYPKIKFKSVGFKTLAEKKFEVTGSLELHGITKIVSIPFTFSQSNGKGLFEGKLTIDRKDFGINGNFMTSSMSGETDIQLKVPVIIN